MWTLNVVCVVTTWRNPGLSRVAMSNQRSFKIGSFRFAAFVPKNNAYNSFWNKILDRNKTFSISSRNFWSKTFRSSLFPNFFWETQSFVLSLKNTGAIWNVLVSFWNHFLNIQMFYFDSWSAWSKQKRSKLIKKNLEIVHKRSLLFALKPRCMETFWSDIY